MFSPCYDGHSSPGPMQSPVHSRPPPGLFIHPPPHIVPGGQHGREPRDRGSCKRIRVKTQGFRQPYTSSNVSASCPGVICRKSLYPRWDRSGSGWGRSLHSSCRTAGIADGARPVAVLRASVENTIAVAAAGIAGMTAPESRQQPTGHCDNAHGRPLSDRSAVNPGIFIVFISHLLLAG